MTVEARRNYIMETDVINLQVLCLYDATIDLLSCDCFGGASTRSSSFTFDADAWFWPGTRKP
jgi:hypothetical protein